MNAKSKCLKRSYIYAETKTFIRKIFLFKTIKWRINKRLIYTMSNFMKNWQTANVHPIETCVLVEQHIGNISVLIKR